MKSLKFSPMFHNEVIYWLENKWQRKLDKHERHLLAEVHDYVRTNMEAEEIRIVEVRDDKSSSIIT